MRSTLKAQKSPKAPDGILPPLVFGFVSCFGFCELPQMSQGKQENDRFRMLGGTEVNTATAQQVHCGFTFDSRPFCGEFSKLSLLRIWESQNSWDALCSTQIALKYSKKIVHMTQNHKK